MRIRLTVALFLSICTLLGCAETTPRVAGPDADANQMEESVSITKDGITYIASNPRMAGTNSSVSDVSTLAPTGISGTLAITGTSNGSGTPQSIAIVFRNTVGRLLWRTVIDVSSFPADSTVTYFEQTPTDSLLIERTTAGELQTGVYTYNGGTAHTFSWSTDEAPSDSLQEAFLDAFPDLGTLLDNDAGTMALSIAVDEGYVNWLEENLASSTEKTWMSSKNVPPIELLCRIVAMCDLKCMIGLGNPLCPFCGMLTVPCTIYWIYCWMFGC